MIYGLNEEWTPVYSSKSISFEQITSSTGMSQAPPDADAIISEFQANLIYTFVITSMLALVAYEYILTLNQEVAMVWRRKWTSVTWLFVANRYIMIAVAILNISSYTVQSCLPSHILWDVLQLIQYFIFATFSALRVFAIWDRNMPMTLLVWVLNLVPIPINVYVFFKSTIIFAVDPVFGTVCSGISNVPPRIFFDLALVTRLSVITVDVLVLALTWSKTFIHRRAAMKAGVHTPLSSLLLRDGTIYFVALFAMNIAQVLVNTVTSFHDASPVPTITDVLTPILISRFLLNLRQLGEPENETQSRFNSRFSIPGFRVPTLASFVGNMGADLDHGGPAGVMEDEVEDVINAPAETSVDTTTEPHSGAFLTENICDIEEIRRHVV